MRTIGRRSVSSFLAVLANVAWFVVAVLLTLAIGLLIISPWINPPAIEVSLVVPVAFTLDPATHPVTSPSLEVQHVQITDVRGSLMFSPDSSALVAVSALALIAVFVGMMWMLAQLRALLCTLRDGKPFVAANAVRIRRMAWGLILGELARAGFTYVGSHYAVVRFAAGGLRFESHSDLNVLAIIAGLIILVIAEVFRAGTRLDEDQALTV